MGGGISFMVSWFLRFLVLGLLICWFLGLLESWFQSFKVSKFLGFKVPQIAPQLQGILRIDRGSGGGRPFSGGQSDAAHLLLST